MALAVAIGVYLASTQGASSSGGTAPAASTQSLLWFLNNYA